MPTRIRQSHLLRMMKGSVLRHIDRRPINQRDALKRSYAEILDSLAYWIRATEEAELDAGVDDPNFDPVREFVP